MLICCVFPDRKDCNLGIEDLNENGLDMALVPSSAVVAKFIVK